MKLKDAYRVAKDKITMRRIERMLKSAKKAEQKMIETALKLENYGK